MRYTSSKTEIILRAMYAFLFIRCSVSNPTPPKWQKGAVKDCERSGFAWRNTGWLRFHTSHGAEPARYGTWNRTLQRANQAPGVPSSDATAGWSALGPADWAQSRERSSSSQLSSSMSQSPGSPFPRTLAGCPAPPRADSELLRSLGRAARGCHGNRTPPPPLHARRELTDSAWARAPPPPPPHPTPLESRHGRPADRPAAPR
ncbi:RUN and SH3 domain-containing protein 1-like [Heterocephalus glaber]|uniref:RUN and SH3 domain-containing protein 1-like n=1 Tax=Heterocephalus glaber TaxID=10181 RepID=A0AAX6R835_HETGA|nr:RUN and SH3 domain-containing protein 1-like [Heterocephalus glaber]